MPKLATELLGRSSVVVRRKSRAASFQLFANAVLVYKLCLFWCSVTKGIFSGPPPALKMPKGYIAPQARVGGRDTPRDWNFAHSFRPVGCIDSRRETDLVAGRDMRSVVDRRRMVDLRGNSHGRRVRWEPLLLWPDSLQLSLVSLRGDREKSVI